MSHASKSSKSFTETVFLWLIIRARWFFIICIPSLLYALLRYVITIRMILSLSPRFIEGGGVVGFFFTMGFISLISSIYILCSLL